MTYNVELSKSSIKFLKKISKKDSEIILNKIYSIRENPFRYLKKLSGSRLWRLRIMDYRSVIDVVVSRRKIYVLRIDKRSKVYDKI